MMYQGTVDKECKNGDVLVDDCNDGAQDPACWENRIKGELDARLELNRLYRTRLCRRRTGKTLDLSKVD